MDLALNNLRKLFSKDGFYIKLPIKVDMPLKKETKTSLTIICSLVSDLGHSFLWSSYPSAGEIQSVYSKLRRQSLFLGGVLPFCRGIQSAYSKPH